MSNFSIGLVCHGLLRTLPAGTIKSNRVILKEDGLYVLRPGQSISLEPDDYEVAFGGPEKWSIDRAAMEFAKMHLRNLTNDTYEAVREYCRATGQEASLRSQRWYHFLRLTRHALTHTQQWRFTPRDLKLLPVSWSGKTIEASMQGTEPDYDFYDWHDGVKLWEEVYRFAETLR